ncbi:MAG: hypothetical protein ACXITV_13115 [Luteibaculaceae bacterium]
MRWFDKIIGKLFFPVSGEISGEPFLEEPIIRGAKFSADFKSWEQSHYNLLVKASQIIYEAYTYGKFNGATVKNEIGRDSLELEENFLDSEFSDSFIFFAEHIKSILLKRGYFQQEATRKIFDKVDCVETFELINLRPGYRKSKKNRGDQHWGEISIQIRFINDVPVDFKLERYYHTEQEEYRDFFEFLAMVLHFPLV